MVTHRKRPTASASNSDHSVTRDSSFKRVICDIRNTDNSGINTELLYDYEPVYQKDDRKDLPEMQVTQNAEPQAIGPLTGITISLRSSTRI